MLAVKPSRYSIAATRLDFTCVWHPIIRVHRIDFDLRWIKVILYLFGFECCNLKPLPYSGDLLVTLHSRSKIQVFVDQFQARNAWTRINHPFTKCQMLLKPFNTAFDIRNVKRL